MTCLEKLRQDNPDMHTLDLGFKAGESCPGDYGYPSDTGCCDDCRKCWDREIPEETPTIVPDHKNMPVDYVKKELVGVSIDTPLECTVYGAGPLVTVPNSIKDSGDRTEFESGAVRDMREGKGRCDLMPLEVVANYICEDNDDTNRVLWALRKFQKTNSTSYLYSALNSFDGACYGDCFTMFLEVAKHFEEGAKKYGPDNWRRGMPTWCYIDSAVRHYLKWLRGDNDEPHHRAFVWNLLCCIWEVDYREKDEATK